MPLRFSAIVAALVLMFAGNAYAQDSADVMIEQPHDMHALGAIAAKRDLPVLLMFSADGCPYCERVEEDFLKPMLISGDYTNKVLIRMVKVDDAGDVTDFDGRRMSMDDFARRYQVRVTPTVVFLDAHGHQLAQRLIGISTPDFYGGDLDNAIDHSLALLHGHTRVSGL